MAQNYKLNVGLDVAAAKLNSRDIIEQGNDRQAILHYNILF